MNTPRTEVSGGWRCAANRRRRQLGGRGWGGLVLGLVLSTGGWAGMHADEPVPAPAVPVVVPVSAPALTTSAGVVGGALTNLPGSVSVPLGDPLMVQPAVEVLQDIAARERSELINRGTREALDEQTKDSLRPLTVEEAGSPLRQVSRDRSLRALADLFDPFAPLPKPYREVAPAFDDQHRLEQDLPPSLRSYGGTTRPRTAIDPTTHEYGWTLFRMSTKAEKEREERIREGRKRR